MEYAGPTLIILALFLLSCLLCWVASWLEFLGPLFSLLFFLGGTLGVLLVVDTLCYHYSLRQDKIMMQQSRQKQQG
jgi:hypothetical protein